MANNDNGGPAFPLHPGVPYDPAWKASHGASLWDFYAAHALMGLTSTLIPNMGEPKGDMLALDAAAIADAMLAERKKRWP